MTAQPSNPDPMESGSVPRRRPHPRPTPQASQEVERALRLLRTKIHEQGFTQLRVQQALGWGRTYISQLLRRQKSLRFDQILQILEVVEIEPAEFFSELYDLRPNDSTRSRPSSASGVRFAAATLEGFQKRHGDSYPGGSDLRSAVHRMMQLLVEKSVLSHEELGEVFPSARS